MSIEDEELGRLTNEHLHSHDEASRLKAELEQVGESLILLGNNIKKNPQQIRPEEARVILKDQRNEDRPILWPTLSISKTLQMLDQFKKATEHEREITDQSRDLGMRHIVDGLENRKGPSPNILR